MSRDMTDTNVIIWRLVPKEETVLNHGRRVWRPRPIIVMA